MKKYYGMKVTTFYDWMKFLGCILLVLLALELAYAAYERSELQREKQNYEKEIEKQYYDYYTNKMLLLDYLIELEVQEVKREQDFCRYMESAKVQDLYTLFYTYNDISNLRCDIETIMDKFSDDEKIKLDYQKMHDAYEEWENWNLYILWLMVYGNEFYETGEKQGGFNDKWVPEKFWEVEFLYDTGFDDSMLNSDDKIILARNMTEWEETDEKRLDFIEAKSKLMMQLKYSKNKEATEEVCFEAEAALENCYVWIKVTLGLIVMLILVNYFVLDRYIMYPLRIRKLEAEDVRIEIPSMKTIFENVVKKHCNK